MAGRGRPRLYEGKGAPELRFRAADPEMAAMVAARVEADGAKDASTWLREAVARRLARCEVCGQELRVQERAAGRCASH